MLERMFQHHTAITEDENRPRVDLGKSACKLRNLKTSSHSKKHPWNLYKQLRTSMIKQSCKLKHPESKNPQHCRAPFVHVFPISPHGEDHTASIFHRADRLGTAAVDSRAWNGKHLETAWNAFSSLAAQCRKFAAN